MKKFFLLFLVFVVLGTAGFFGVRWFLSTNSTATSETANDTYVPPADPEIPDFIDLQPIVDEWVSQYAHGEVAVEIYDLNNAAVAASYRPTATMQPLSLYKLFYTYDGYAQIDAGADNPDDLYLGNYTLGECLDKMIRESHNPCAETMLGESARESRVGQLVKDLGLVNTRSDGLQTSAHDVSLLLQHYYAHPEWSETSWLKYRDSALNQPPTAAGDFRQGLPSGISIATVFDKVGWQGGAGGGTGWNFYNDAAIVEFPEIDQAGDLVQVIDSNTVMTSADDNSETSTTSTSTNTSISATSEVDENESEKIAVSPSATDEQNNASERLAVSTNYEQVSISYTNLTDSNGEELIIPASTENTSAASITSDEEIDHNGAKDASITNTESTSNIMRTKIVTLDENQYEYIPEVQPRRYIMVVMTRNTSHLTVRALGTMLEEAILSYQFSKVHNSEISTTENN